MWAGMLVADGRLSRLLARSYATGHESGFQPVEDGLEAEFEAVFGRRGIVGSRRIKAGAQPWEPRGNLTGSRHAVAH